MTTQADKPTADRRNSVEVIQWGEDDFGWHRLDNGKVVSDSGEGYTHLSRAIERATLEAAAHGVGVVYANGLEPEPEPAE